MNTEHSVLKLQEIKVELSRFREKIGKRKGHKFPESLWDEICNLQLPQNMICRELNIRKPSFIRELSQRKKSSGNSDSSTPLFVPVDVITGSQDSEEKNGLRIEINIRDGVLCLQSSSDLGIRVLEITDRFLSCCR
jgi:hypothetical protein